MLLVLAVVGFWVWWEYGPPKGLVAIGGSWQVAKEVGFIPNPDKRFLTCGLYRAKDDAGVVKVDEAVTRYHFYAPDCVVYQTIRPEFSGVVFAVCGERTPIAFMSDTSWDYEYATEGLRLEKGTTLGGSSIVVKTTKLKPIERIVALAQQQPPYRKNWQKDAGFRMNGPYKDDLVADVEVKEEPK